MRLRFPKPLLQPVPGRSDTMHHPSYRRSTPLIAVVSSLVLLIVVLYLSFQSGFNDIPTQLEEDIGDTASGILEVEACGLFPSPHADRMQKCCEFSPSWFYCLPNLVIAGAQKGGTTALYSYLLFHPEILPGSKKEFHVFDFDDKFSHLKSKLHTLLPRRTKQELDQHIVLDSTPSYIADHKVCARMRTVLSPDARLVLLLRNPIDRMWSDVNMKRRRIHAQHELLNVLVPKYHAELQACMNESRVLRNITAFRACLPSTLGTHGRISAFQKYFTVKKKSVSTSTFVQDCLTTRVRALECVQGKYSNILRETMPEIPRVLYEEAGRLKHNMSSCCASPSSKKPVLERQRAFYGDFPAGCGEDCFPRAKMMSDISKNFVWRSLYYPQLKHCFDSIHSNRVLIINSDDLKRDPQTVLTEIMVHAGLSIAPGQQMARLTPQELQQAFHARFPDFEAMTGWKHDDTFVESAMPNEVREYFQTFFRPFNRKLFTLLDREPFPGWDV